MRISDWGKGNTVIGFWVFVGLAASALIVVLIAGRSH